MEHGTPFNLLLRLNHLHGRWQIIPPTSEHDISTQRKIVQGEPTFTRVNKTHIRKALAHISHISSVPTDKNTPKVSWNTSQKSRTAESNTSYETYKLRGRQKDHNNVTTVADAKYISIQLKASDFSFMDSSGFKKWFLKVQRRGNVCKPVTAGNSVL